jgi:glycosyltransferase involved in cell wall biosynthesis
MMVAPPAAMPFATLRVVGIADVTSVHTQKWANYLVARGHALHILSYRSGGTRPAGLDKRVTVADWTLPDLHIKRCWLSIHAVKRLREMVRKPNIDLVHAHFLGPGAWYAALAGQRPLVVSVMGGGDVRGTRWRPQSIADRLLTPYTLRHADLITCWSHNLLGAVRHIVPASTPVEVIVGGIDLDRFKRSPDASHVRRRLDLASDAFVILSPRLFWPLQNIDTIVAAMPKVLAAEPRARLVLVKYRAGHFPEYESRIEALIDQLAVRAAIRAVAEIPNEDMPAYYSAADCTVSVPSTDGTPMTVMESLAVETPAVISDLPDYDGDIFGGGDAVVRVKPADASSLADGLISLARDTELRRRLGRKGRQIAVARADYHVEMQRLEAAYNRLKRRTS